MQDYKDDVAKLVEFLGGKENISTAMHCVTRLRLVLVDTTKANVKAIEELKMVQGTFTQAGQFQVIIGATVPKVFDEFSSQTGISTTSKENLKSEAKNNQTKLEALMSNLAEIFMPTLPALISGGLILGLRNILEGIDFGGTTLVEKSQFLNALNAFLWVPGEAIFHFLPVILCWSTVRKFKGSEVLAIVMGIMLVSPQLLNAYGYADALAKGTVPFWDFGFFTIQKVGYQAQVIPAILAGIMLAKLELFLKRYMRGTLELIVVPIVALLTTLIVSYIVLGPISREIGNALAWFFKMVLTGPFSFLGAFIFGFFYAPLVITGLHHTFIAVDLQMVANIGGTMIFPMLALSNIAQGSAVIGSIFVLRTQKHKEMATPSAVSAYLGITEPAMYGVNLKLKYPFFAAIIGSACAAIISTMGGVLANGIGIGGIPAILSIKPQFYITYLIAMVVAVVVPIILTIVLSKFFKSE